MLRLQLLQLARGLSSAHAQQALLAVPSKLPALVGGMRRASGGRLAGHTHAMPGAAVSS